MTLAAGFVLSDGLLLCADTLHTDGSTKEYRDKIFTWRGKSAGVCFALAGNSLVARMVIEDCRAALTAGDSELDEWTNEDILEVLRPIIRDSFVEQVEARPYEDRGMADFQLLLGLVTKSGEPTMYATWRTTLAPVDRFECLGVGRQLGRSIVEPSYERGMTVDDAAILAIYMLASAKEWVDGVGGKSQFVVIKNKVLGSVVPHDVNRAEPLTLEYKRLSNKLLLALARHDDVMGERFKQELDDFVKDVQRTRKDWATLAAQSRDLSISLSESIRSSAQLFPPHLSTAHDQAATPFALRVSVDEKKADK